MKHEVASIAPVDNVVVHHFCKSGSLIFETGAFDWATRRRLNGDEKQAALVLYSSGTAQSASVV